LEAPTVRRLNRVTARHSGMGALATLAVCAALIDPARVCAAPIAVETLFKKPQYGGAVLSPSGRYLAVLLGVKDRQGVAVMDLDEKGINVMPTAEGDAISFVWQNDKRMIVNVGDLHRATGEAPTASAIWAVDRDGGNATRLWGQLVRVIPGTDDILVAASSRSRYSLDLFRVNSRSGRREMLTFESPGNVVQWIVDFDGVVRAAVTADPRNDKSAWYVRKSADAPWQKVEESALGNLSSPMEFSPDGKTLYVNSRRNDDRYAIYEYTIESAKWTGPVVQHPERDIVGSFVTDQTAKKLLGLRYADDLPSAVWFDKESATVQASVDAALPDTVNFLQHRGDRWIVTAVSDRDPGDVYLLERSSMKMTKLFSYEPWIDPSAMATTRWVRYPSRDGLAIPALLTVPQGKGEKPVPLVVDIHGGPYVNASGAMYNPEVQFFASRGYAVLRPQFRGTSGFGAKFAKAGFRKWGDEMQDDLEDGVKWSVAQGIADPDRVCFFGASYGGYAAIWQTIKNPRMIKCAVAIAAVTSIDYMFDNAQTDLSYLADRSSKMALEIGDPATERARFKRVSPIEHARDAGVPLLLAYGLSDLRVPIVHGNDFKRALDKYGKSYEWVTYAKEAHGLSSDENVFDFYNRVDSFLAKYLSVSLPR
jgi:dipeptidyl aminopeptidase/acylaminoacyl peptidase